MINLFNCRSLIPLNEKCRVQCYWFCVDRKQPVLDYKEHIKGYDPNKEENHIAESKVNEFFTQQEIEALEGYLATKNLGLEVTKVDYLPVESDSTGLQHFPLGGGTYLIHLSEHEGYYLPFKVCGVVDSEDKDDWSKFN